MFFPLVFSLFFFVLDQFRTIDRIGLVFYYIANWQKTASKVLLEDQYNMSGDNVCIGLTREWPVTPSLVAYESFKVHPIYPSPFNAIVFTRVTCSKPERNELVFLAPEIDENRSLFRPFQLRSLFFDVSRRWEMM